VCTALKTAEIKQMYVVDSSIRDTTIRTSELRTLARQLEGNERVEQLYCK
jgi:hypothetical protein